MNTLYFKPLEELHEYSGCKLMEVGYIEDGELNKVSTCSDVINFGFASLYDMPKDLNIDVDKNGVVSLWSYSSTLSWKQPVLSSAIVKVGDVDKGEIK